MQNELFLIIILQKSLICIALDICYSHIQNRFTNFQECFPCDKYGKLNIKPILELINVFVHLIQLDIFVRQNTSQNSPDKICSQRLTEYLQKYATIEYQRMHIIAEKSAKSQAADTIRMPFTAEKLLFILDLIEEELFSNIPSYADVFKRYKIRNYSIPNSIEAT